MRSTTTLAALCAVTALALTACGSDSGDTKSAKSGGPARATGSPRSSIAGESGPAIANKAIAATKKATGMTIDLNGTMDGEHTVYHMAMDAKGDCAGTISMGRQGTVQMVKKGGTAYMKYDQAFWKSQGKDAAAAGEMIGDRWTKTRALGPDDTGLASACDLDQYLTDFETGPNLARKGGTTVVDGRPAVTVSEKDGAETYTMYVSTVGKPYILRVVVAGGKEPGTATFTDYDQPVKAKAPTGDVVDIDTLGG